MKLFEYPQINHQQARYLQLADTVRQAIRSGQLVAGDALPSVKSISVDMQVNRHTVMKALAELIAEGWIESKQRVGYKVVEHLPVENSQLQLSSTQINAPFNYRLVRAGSALPQYPAQTFEYNYSGGQPDLNNFPFAEFKSYMSDALSRPNIQELGYGETAGTSGLVWEVKQFLRKTRAITDREILITNGSQEAMYIVAQLLLKAGDKVAVEALGYPPAMAAFRSAGAELVGIKQDHKGLVPEDLEAKIKQGDIRLIYLTPLHQYPTTVTLTISRRIEVYQLAAKHQIPIIEDDYDHEFHYRCQPLAPMAASDPQQLVIYISTFSKIMFAGARIGIMAVSQPLAKAIAEYRLMICHKSNVLMQGAIARWMQSGGFERHLRRTTRINQQRRDNVVAFLRELDLFEFDVPDGGMALWLKIKNDQISAKALSLKARELGAYVQHEEDYHLHLSSNADRHIRLGFAGMDEAKWKRGMQLLIEHFDDLADISIV